MSFSVKQETDSVKRCLNALNKTKIILNKIYVKYETTIDSDVKQELIQLNSELNSVFKVEQQMSQQNLSIGNHLIGDQRQQQLDGMDTTLKRFVKKEVQSEHLDTLRSEDLKQELKDYWDLMVRSINGRSDTISGNTLYGSSTSDQRRRGENGLRRTFDGNLFLCDYPDCGQTFNTEKRYEEHRMMRSNGNHFFCEVNNCFKTFAQKSQLLAHESTHQKFVCLWFQCNQKFPTKGRLIGHWHRNHV